MSAVSRLWLAIRLPDLPLTALSAEEFADRPVVVAQKKRVIFANSAAAAAGARAGMDLTTAQLLSGCEVVERDETKEQAVLSELSEQLYQFSPYIERYSSAALAQSALLLEVSSCLKLFGGLKALSEKLFAHLAATPWGFVDGLGHTAAAAWYLSFAGYDITGGEGGGRERRSLFIERLHQLPMELWCDYPDALDALLRTGFKTFGDLARQIDGTSLASLKKRLGAEFTEQVCAVYDIDHNFQQAPLFERPRDLYRPREWFEEEIQFDYPVKEVAQLQPAMETLLQALSRYLLQHQQQCQTIKWCIADIYQHRENICVYSDEPQSQWQLFYELSLIQFGNRQLRFEVDTLRLTCQQLLPLHTHSRCLQFEAGRAHRSLQDFTVTIAKLKARLGEDAVYKVGYRDSRVPERSQATVGLAEKSPQQLPDIHARALRPSWLFTQPEPVEERGGRLYWQGYLTPLAGPERMIGEWWEQRVARDYFLARRHDHLLVWLYWDLYRKAWYVHGVFA